MLNEATFEVGSGKMRMSDPCYTRDDGVYRNAAMTVPVRNGTWYAVVERSDGRIATLCVYHEDVAPCREGEPVGEDRFGVDSGQFGFFDDAEYPQGEVGEYSDPQSFYARCCTATSGKQLFGAVDGVGVVSSSGDGDGSYRVTGRKIGDEYVSLRVVFIGEEDEEDES